MLDTFIASARTSAIGRRLLGEIDAQQQLATSRTAAAQRLAAARKRQADAGPALANKIADAEAALRDAHAAHLVAQQKRYAEIGALKSDMVRLDHAADVEEATLLRTSSSAIGDFHYELLAIETETRQAITSHDSHSVRDDGTSWVREKISASNRAAVQARLDAIKIARVEAETLKLLPLDSDEIGRRLAAIRDSIPSASTLEQMTAA